MTNIDKKGYQPVTIRCFSKDRQLLFENLMLCAYNITDLKIVAVGKDCLPFQNDNYIYVCNPLKWGAVADYTIYEKALALFLKGLSSSFMRKPVIGLCIPASLTEVEKKAFMDAVATISKEITLFCMPFEKVQSYLAVTKDQYGIYKKINYYVEFVSEYYNSEFYV